jgi:hypothetical protein
MKSKKDWTRMQQVGTKGSKVNLQKEETKLLTLMR